MFKNLYEYEKNNKSIYDGVREYCITEKVNEEFIRCSIIKEREIKPMKRMVLILVSVIGLFITAMLSMHIKNESELKSIGYYEADLNELEDFIYTTDSEMEDRK